MLFAGAEPAVVVFEVTTAAALVFGIGIHVVTLFLAVFYLTIVHGVMVWVANQDPHMTALYARSLSARDFYAPQSTIHSVSSAGTPSIPRSK